MSDVNYIACAQQVIFGCGSLARLGEAVAGFGWRRLMLCATGSARRSC